MDTPALYNRSRVEADDDVGADYRSLEHDWTDRHQRLENRARALVGTVGLCVVAIVALVLVVLYLALFRAPQPYVLNVDERGSVAFGGFLNGDFSITDEMLPSQIMRFVENWRTVTPDNTQQKRNVARLYCMVTDRAPARQRLNEHFREPQNDPFTRNVRSSVTTDMRQISKLGGSSWQVEWYETTRAHDGQVEGDAQTWRATMIVEKGPTPNKECLEGNPLGVYVQELSWTAVR